ncbi:hypothetical protein H5410_044072 [Solanum commersonii]|uniref:Uncharacterized protein n=1 Tax=Solanum commersonii TaxID=4109 RepID=A0A9J5Y365_SOLCO|nr:hypothetical protein H5410_044072 [Solanum commersonii]
MEQVNPHGQNDSFSRLNKPRTNSPSIFVIRNSDLIFAKNFHGRSLKPYIWRQLTLTAKTSYFQGQTSIRAGKHPFCQFSCAIFHGIFGDLDF